MTIFLDDAGYGDLLFGAVIGAYRPETDHFIYDVIDVKYFQQPLYAKKEYLNEASRIAYRLIQRLKPEDGEWIKICQGYILDRATETIIETYDKKRVIRVKVDGRTQKYVEQAYIDEIYNLGYIAIPDRMEKRAKSFFHMLRWVNANPEMLKYTKSGWPRLKRYKIFRKTHNKTI